MDLKTILLAVCGLSVACCGTLMLGLFLLARMTGGSMFLPIISVFGGMLFKEKREGEEEDIEREYRPSRRRQRESGLRKQRPDLDFDQALDRYRAQGGRRKRGGARPPTTPEETTGQDSDDFDSSDLPGLRSNRSRPRRDVRRSGLDSSDDEVFGGMFDEDGDGYADM